MRSRRTPPITGLEAGPLLRECELRGPDFGLPWFELTTESICSYYHNNNLKKKVKVDDLCAIWKTLQNIDKCELIIVKPFKELLHLSGVTLVILFDSDTHQKTSLTLHWAMHTYPIL